MASRTRMAEILDPTSPAGAAGVGEVTYGQNVCREVVKQLIKPVGRLRRRRNSPLLRRLHVIVRARVQHGLIAVLCGVLSACAAPPTPGRVIAVPQSGPVSASGSPSANEIPCAHAIDGLSAPPADHDVVLDAVALPTMVLQVNAADEPGWFFAKDGLIMRSNAVIELSVSAESRRNTLIGWGSPGPRGTELHLPGCPGGFEWLVFAGGYTVVAPTCVTLTIRTAAGEAHARIGVGAHCPATRTPSSGSGT